MVGRVDNPVRSYEEFKAFIKEETAKAREEVSGWIQNPNVDSVGCVDKLTLKGSVNPPGGGMFLYNERLLETFLKTRQGGNGTLYIHDYCGYMRVEMGIGTLKEQRAHMERFQKNLNGLQKKYNTKFSVVCETEGSARPYMK